jgi:heptosyltransferase-1
MKVLVVKMSSLGDLVHMLPAIDEALHRLPELTIDWVAEEAFAAIPGWHPAVRRVIPIAWRRWRKQLMQPRTWRELRAFVRLLGSERYDLVLDTQGLLKSALVAALAKGPKVGHDFATAREGLAALFYRRRYHATWEQHAIARQRSLTAQALGYPMGGEADFSYGVSAPTAADLVLPSNFLLALHGTARAEKEYPEADWQALLAKIASPAQPILLPWGNVHEFARATRLAAAVPHVEVLPPLDLQAMAAVIGCARAVIGVDTGLMHLAAAFGKPGLGLYPATSAARFGVRAAPGGPVIENLSAAADLQPARVAEKIAQMVAR